MAQFTFKQFIQTAVIPQDETEDFYIEALRMLYRMPNIVTEQQLRRYLFISNAPLELLSLAPKVWRAFEAAQGHVAASEVS